MLVEKELRACPQRKKRNIDDNLINQVIESVEQAFVKVNTRIGRREVASVVAATSSIPPSTSTEVLLALLSLNELLYKRTKTDYCSFHQGVYLGYRIQGTVSFD
jgi:hypothetical protein